MRFQIKKLKEIPDRARVYLLLAAFFIALPSIGHIDINSGKMLVASPAMKQEPFARSVVYLVQHDLSQAYGYILDTPSYDQA